MRIRSVFAILSLVGFLALSQAFAEEAAAPAAAENSPAPSSPAPESISGQVQVTQQPAATTAEASLTAADYLEIQTKPGESKNRLRHHTITINNKLARHIEILQVEIVNGLSEDAYAQAQLTQAQKSQAKRRVAGGLLRGVTGIATSFVPYAGVGSYAAYQAIGAGTYAANSAADAIANAQPNMPGYTGERIVQRAGNILISPKQQYHCTAVVPEAQQPQVKIIFKDLQSNQIFDIQK